MYAASPTTKRPGKINKKKRFAKLKRQVERQKKNIILHIHIRWTNCRNGRKPREIRLCHKDNIILDINIICIVEIIEIDEK